MYNLCMISVRKFRLQTTIGVHWHNSSYDSYMPDTTDLLDVVNWLKTVKLPLNQEYRILLYNVPLVEFDVENLWILETYL